MAEINGEKPIGHNNSGVWERISQLQKEQVENGEIVSTPTALFRFPFLNDKRYLSSPNRNILRQLAGAESTVENAQKIIEDLEIKKPVTLTRKIPEEEKNVLIPSFGFGGRALSPTEVELYFDPNSPCIIESLSVWGDRQIAHELTHVARNQVKMRGNTLLDFIINEGLSTHYEEHWGGIYLPSKWGHALDRDQIKKEWQIAKRESSFTNFDYKGWFFGSNKSHPPYAGYSLGVAIVDEYFKRYPNEKMAKVVKMPSKKILKESKFNL